MQMTWFCMGESEEDLRGTVGSFVEMCMRFAWMGGDWSICQNLNIWDVFWMNQVQMRQSAVGRW